MTGTSVLALTFKNGIVITADKLASYGSLARFRNLERLTLLGDRVVMGTSGEYSDLDATRQMLEAWQRAEYCSSVSEVGRNGWSVWDGLTPRRVYAYLQNLMYARRSKVDPLWNSHVICGLEQGADNGKS